MCRIESSVQTMRLICDDRLERIKSCAGNRLVCFQIYSAARDHRIYGAGKMLGIFLIHRPIGVARVARWVCDRSVWFCNRPAMSRVMPSFMEPTNAEAGSSDTLRSPAGLARSGLPGGTTKVKAQALGTGRSSS